MKLNLRFFEFTGWLGMVLILGAYVLVIFQIFSPQNVWYLVLNIVGSVAIIFHESSQKDYAPTILNIVWAAVALVALLRIIIAP